MTEKFINKNVIQLWFTNQLWFGKHNIINNYCRPTFTTD